MNRLSDSLAGLLVYIIHRPEENRFTRGTKRSSGKQTQNVN